MNPFKPEKNVMTNPLYASPKREERDDSHYFEGKPDVDIWRMFRQGHEGAFRYIYGKYLIDLLRYGYHFTNDRELIKDSIHDLFVELRQGKNISETNSIKFYLLKAFRWKIQHVVSARKKLSHVDLRATSFQTEIEVSIETELIKSQQDQEMLIQLNKALSRLSNRQKEALYHFYHQNCTYEQVAQIMKLSNIKSARNLIYKALDSLKAYYSLVR
jgi:RNA polymerase sigma factor (sigma-70 family)